MPEEADGQGSLAHRNPRSRAPDPRGYLLLALNSRYSVELWSEGWRLRTEQCGRVLLGCGRGRGQRLEGDRANRDAPVGVEDGGLPALQLNEEGEAGALEEGTGMRIS